MNRVFSTYTLLAALLLSCAAGAAFAQQATYSNARPMFAGVAHRDIAPKAGASNLSQWTGTFTDLTKAKRSFVMVGPDPSSNNSTTTIPVVFVPIKFVYGKSNGNKTFDPNKQMFKGTSVSVSKTILASPIFQSEVDFNQGGTDLGTTQYIDAFQRGNFWGANVQNNTNYHVLLGKPTIIKEQVLNVSPSQGQVGFEFGHTVGLMDFGAMDSVLQGYMRKIKKIQPNALPVFLAYDVYLTSGGCCIGGYHGVNGGAPTGQTYSFSTVHDQVAAFSEDTAALSHEIGEWMDNPFFGRNNVGCSDNSQLEVGDPLVEDDHSYVVNGFTYHLQDLVFLGYFGAPTSTSLHNWLSFQNDKKNVCPGQ